MLWFGSSESPNVVSNLQSLVLKLSKSLKLNKLLPLLLFLKSSSEDIFSLLLETGEKGERENHQSLAFAYVPQPGIEPTTWYVTWLGIKPTTFQSMGQHSNQLSLTSEGQSSSFRLPVLSLTFSPHLYLAIWMPPQPLLTESDSPVPWAWAGVLTLLQGSQGSTG